MKNLSWLAAGQLGETGRSVYHVAITGTQRDQNLSGKELAFTHQMPSALKMIGKEMKSKKRNVQAFQNVLTNGSRKLRLRIMGDTGVSIQMMTFTSRSVIQHHAVR